MKLNQIKSLIQIQKHYSFHDLKNDLNLKNAIYKNPELSNYFTKDGNYIGYQEMEMDSEYIDVHEDISYTKDVVSLHSHLFYEILFIRSGDLQYLIGDTRYQIQRNDIVIIPSGLSHRPLFLEKLHQPYRRTVLWINSNFYKKCKLDFYRFDDIKKEVPIQTQYIIRPTGSILNQIEQIFDMLLYEKTHIRPGNELFCIGLYIQLICLIYRTNLYQNTTYPQPEKAALLDDIIHYIEDHLADEISLKSISTKFLVSQSTISQLFKKRMDISFYKLVTQRRLIESKNYISKHTPLKEIPELCGFSDYSVFYKAFIKEYGISPKEYKMRIKI